MVLKLTVWKLSLKSFLISRILLWSQWITFCFPISGEDCIMSSDCDITKGLCCQVITKLLNEDCFSHQGHSCNFTTFIYIIFNFTGSTKTSASSTKGELFFKPLVSVFSQVFLVSEHVPRNSWNFSTCVPKTILFYQVSNLVLLKGIKYVGTRTTGWERLEKARERYYSVGSWS